MDVTKAKVDFERRHIELEGSEDFVRSYLDLFKAEIAKLTADGGSQPINGSSNGKRATRPSKAKSKAMAATPANADSGNNEEEVAGSPKKPSRGKGAPKVSAERFDLHGSGDVPSLKHFMEQKAPGTSHARVTVVIGYYIAELLQLGYFTLGQLEYGYKMLNLRRPAHLKQVLIDTKNRKDWCEPDPEHADAWRMTRAGEIFVADALPDK